MGPYAMNVAVEAPTYHDELCRAMTWLGQQNNTVFIGQGVGVPGTAMSDSLKGVPLEKRIEFPVAEEMQVGMCVGMSLKGYVPICIIPRWNFALRAADQIINHLDRLPLYSAGGYKPKVIIRVAVPSTSPFNPGPQHDADFTDMFEGELRSVGLFRLSTQASIDTCYRYAYERMFGTILVEYTDQYRNARGSK